MGCNLCDIEDFTTSQLETELLRRRESGQAGSCWYCRKPLGEHTCKVAQGWDSTGDNSSDATGGIDLAARTHQ